MWFLCGLLCLAVNKDLLQSRATPAMVEQEPEVISTNAREELSTDTLKVYPTEFALWLSQADIEMTGESMVLPIFLHMVQLQKKFIEITWNITLICHSKEEHSSSGQACFFLFFFFYFKAF